MTMADMHADSQPMKTWWQVSAATTDPRPKVMTDAEWPAAWQAAKRVVHLARHATVPVASAIGPAATRVEPARVGRKMVEGFIFFLLFRSWEIGVLCL